MRARVGTPVNRAAGSLVPRALFGLRGGKVVGRQVGMAGRKATHRRSHCTHGHHAGGHPGGRGSSVPYRCPTVSGGEAGVGLSSRTASSERSRDAGAGWRAPAEALAAATSRAGLGLRPGSRTRRAATAGSRRQAPPPGPHTASPPRSALIPPDPVEARRPREEAGAARTRGGRGRRAAGGYHGRSGRVAAEPACRRT